MLSFGPRTLLGLLTTASEYMDSFGLQEDLVFSGMEFCLEGKLVLFNWFGHDEVFGWVVRFSTAGLDTSVKLVFKVQGGWILHMCSCFLKVIISFELFGRMTSPFTTILTCGGGHAAL